MGALCAGWAAQGAQDKRRKLMHKLATCDAEATGGSVHQHRLLCGTMNECNVRSTDPRPPAHHTRHLHLTFAEVRERRSAGREVRRRRELRLEREWSIYCAEQSHQTGSRGAVSPTWGRKVCVE